MNPKIELDAGLQAYVDGAKRQSTSKSEDDAMQQRLMARLENHQEPWESSGTRSGFYRLKVWLDSLSGMSAMAKLGMAGSFAFAGVLTIGLLLSSSVSSPAFASVVQKLTEITSMHYQGQMRSNGQDLMSVEVFYLAPSKVRVVTTPNVGAAQPLPMINILDTELGKGLILMPQAKMAMPFEFLPGAVTDSPEDDPLHWLDTILNHKGDVEVLDSVRIGNTQAVGFVIVESGLTIMLWVDAATNLPMQIRLEMDEMDGQSPFVFEADVQFNQDLDEALFSLHATGDYQIENED